MPAPPLPAPNITTAMKIDRSVRVVRAKNVTALNIVERESLQSQNGSAQSSPVLYHSTGINTEPPRNGIVFEAIHGRKPTFNDLEHNVGLAAIGRYTYAGEVKPHELVYGKPFSATLKAKSTYADSAFQTESPADCRKALARAKVKASLMVNKYRHITEEAGITIHAESHDDKVIHSEQFPTIVELDAEGNSTGGSVEGLMLPNIYAEDIQPASIAYPNSISTKSEPLAHDAKSLADPHFQMDPTPPRPIAALAPSLRSFDRPLLPIEDYGNEAPQYKQGRNDYSSDDDYEGRPIAASERSDRVDPAEFVVYDAAKYAPSRVATPSVATSRQPDKRKRSEVNNDNSASYQSKRVKVSHSQSAEKEARFEPLHEKPRHASNAINTTVNDKAHEKVGKLSVEPKPESRIVSAPRGPKADRVRQGETKRKDSCDDNRSGRRSRSPDYEIDNKSTSRSAYRERDSRDRPQERRRSRSTDRRELSDSSARGSSAEAATENRQQRSRRSDSGYETRTEPNTSSTKNDRTTRPDMGGPQEATSVTQSKTAIAHAELRKLVQEDNHSLQHVIEDKGTGKNAVRTENIEQQQQAQALGGENATKTRSERPQQQEQSSPVPAEQSTEEKNANHAVQSSDFDEQERAQAAAEEERKRKRRAERFQRQVQPGPSPKVEKVHKETEEETSRMRKGQDLRRERHYAQNHSVEPSRHVYEQPAKNVEKLAPTTNDAMMQARKDQDLQREHHNAQKPSVQPTRNATKRVFDNVDEPAPTNKHNQIGEEVRTSREIAMPRSRRPARAAQKMYVPPTARDTRNNTTLSSDRNEAGYGQTQSDIRGHGGSRGDDSRKKRKY